MVNTVLPLFLIHDQNNHNIIIIAQQSFFTLNKKLVITWRIKKANVTHRPPKYRISSGYLHPFKFLARDAQLKKEPTLGPSTRNSRRATVLQINKILVKRSSKHFKTTIRCMSSTHPQLFAPCCSPYLAEFLAECLVVLFQLLNLMK